MDTKMARMNADERKALGQAMLQRWNTIGIAEHKHLTFVKDMLHRMDSGRGMTTAQRAYFDNIVVADPPETKNPELVKALLAAATVEGMEGEANVLKDFATRTALGYSFSEKQQNWIDALLRTAEKYRIEGMWQPNEEELKTLMLGFSINARYDAFYLAQYPHHLYTALLHVEMWLEYRKNPEGNRKVHLNQHLAQVVMNSDKGVRASMEEFNKRCPIGELVECKHGSLCLIMSESYAELGPRHNYQKNIRGVMDGQVFVKVIQDGQHRSVAISNLVMPVKERVRRKKTIEVV